MKYANLRNDNKYSVQKNTRETIEVSSYSSKSHVETKLKSPTDKYESQYSMTGVKKQRN